MRLRSGVEYDVRRANTKYGERIRRLRRFRRLEFKKICVICEIYGSMILTFFV
jgi:hypothetical protein